MTYRKICIMIKQTYVLALREEILEGSGIFVLRCGKKYIINTEGRTAMTIMDVARYLIYLSYHDGNNYSLTPLKLQKVLYYVQGWSYLWDNKPMFAEVFEAWQYGPVNREVYDQFKIYKGSEIPYKEGARPRCASPEELETIERVWEEYGMESAGELVTMTHEEAPWRNAYQEGTLISNRAIRKYFHENY